MTTSTESHERAESPSVGSRDQHAVDLDSIFACIGRNCLLTPTQARALLAALATAETDRDAADSLAAALRRDVQALTAERDSMRWKLEQLRDSGTAPGAGRQEGA